MRIILDAKYKKADINMVIAKKFQHINAAECYRLLTFLSKFEDMFDSMLCTWNTAPVNLELKGNKNLVCSRPYPLPTVYKSVFR